MLLRVTCIAAKAATRHEIDPCTVALAANKPMHRVSQALGMEVALRTEQDVCSTCVNAQTLVPVYDRRLRKATDWHGAKNR